MFTSLADARRRMALALAILAVLAAAPRVALAGAEIVLDRDFLGGIVAKLPPAPFHKEGQYRGSARNFRLGAIDPKQRRVMVACEVSGEYRSPLLLATGSAAKASPDEGWSGFAFDILAAVKIEPGTGGVPRFAVEIEQIKRRELEGLPGALAKVLGRYFDTIVTQAVDGKAATINAKVNEQLRKKIAAFQDYGVLRDIGYEPGRLILIFDVTKFRPDGVAGHVFGGPRPGTAALHRWARPRLGDHFYTIEPGPPRGRPNYVYEGVACYVYPTPQPGTAPLQRWRGPREAFYTTAENGESFGRRGYRPEAIACHVFPTAQPDTIPFYRFVDPRTNVHFYTTHPHAEFAK